jgi:hypothetical protein
MLDRLTTIRRYFRYVAKLSAERKFGRIEMNMQAGIPTITRFEEQVKPEDWPQATDAQMAEILAGESEDDLIRGKR